MLKRAATIAVGLLLGVGCSGAAPSPVAPVVVDIREPAAGPAPSVSAAPAPAPQPPSRASEYAFDGFQLGSRFATAVMARAPYEMPCDVDPVDHRSGQVVVYGALPCRDRTFP